VRRPRKNRMATVPAWPSSAGGRGRLPARARRSSGGFNLVELMVVIALGAILLSLGVSSYRYVTNANRVSTEVNSLLGDLMLARSEAIKQAAFVITCPSKSGTGCDKTTSWQNGWMVFTDVDNDGTYTATKDVLIRVQKAFPVTTDTFVSDNTVQSVTYNREGFAVGLPTAGGPYITITLHTTPTNTQWTRCLQVSTYGNLTTEKSGATKDCT
jgi:type IV fimbrial biogenesis protein FimT